MFILDLFSGAGGLAEGFVSEGFIPVGHVEMDGDAINTLHTRIVYHFLKSENKLGTYIKYLNKKISRDALYETLPSEIANTVIHDMLSSDSLDSICRKIDTNMECFNCSDLDVLIGGPPCQTYSLISRSNKNYQNENDQRNHLYKIYAKILKRYRPKFFVFENVPGLKNVNGGTIFKELINLISEQGYIVDPKELDASDFGILQKRTRIIITGWRKEYALKEIEYKHNIYKNAVVNDLLTDLVPISPGTENNTYKSEPTPYLFESGLRSLLEIPLTHHMCRYHNENDREIYRIAIRLWNEEGKRLVYSDLPPNLITRKNPHIFTDKYKVVAGNAPYSH